MSLLGGLTKLQKAILSFAMSAWKNLVVMEQMSMKFDT
jgi:hypothetical protein